jgi:hypothetical protein
MMQRNTLAKAALVAASSLLLCSTAFSSSLLESEFEIKIPRQFQQNLIEQKWKTLESRDFTTNWQFPQQTFVSQDIPIVFQGMTLAMKTRLKKPQTGNGDKTVLKLTSSTLEAAIHVDAITVDHVIEREVGGIIGRFRIHARCENVILNLKKNAGNFSFVLSPRVNAGQVGADIRSFDLTWQPGAWTLQNELKCEGAQGFDTLIQEQVQVIAQDSEKFLTPQKPLILDYLDKYFSTLNFDLSTPRELVSSRVDIKTSLVFDETKEDATQGLWAKGRVIIDFQKSTRNKSQKLVLQSSIFAENAGTQVLIRLPQEFAKEVVAEAFSADSWIQRFGSASIPGFSSLMGSRLTQLFVWPELRRYSKSANFLFDLSSNKDFEVSGQGLQYSVKSTIQSKMLAPRGSGFVPFMNFTVPVTSKVQLSVSKGVLNTKLPNPSLGLSYAWDADYLRKYAPSTKFSASKIRDKIQGSLTGKTLSYTLPKIPLYGDANLQIISVDANSKSELNLRLAP